MRILITLIFFVSCCGESNQNKPKKVEPVTAESEKEEVEEQPKDPIVERYMEDFERDMESRGLVVDYFAVFVKIVDKLPGDFVGITYHNPIIDKMEIDLLRVTLSRRVVYHELIHALWWNVPHSPNPESIMFYKEDLTKDNNKITDKELDEVVAYIKSWTEK